MMSSTNKTYSFASSDISNHAVSPVAPMEFSPMPVFFEPTLSNAVKNGEESAILLTYSSAKTVSNNKSIRHGKE